MKWLPAPGSCGYPPALSRWTPGAARRAPQNSGVDVPSRKHETARILPPWYA